MYEWHRRSLFSLPNERTYGTKKREMSFNRTRLVINNRYSIRLCKSLMYNSFIFHCLPHYLSTPRLTLCSLTRVKLVCVVLTLFIHGNGIRCVISYDAERMLSYCKLNSSGKSSTHYTFKPLKLRITILFRDGAWYNY